MSLRLIPANEYRRERWRNGLGWTREIVKECGCGVSGQSAQRGACSCEGFAYRLSIAEIDNDCAFSTFPGCDRVLMLLSGNGIELDFDDGTHEVVAPPHGRIAFVGERGVQCRLLDGPTTDFNAMVRRDRCTMQVYHRPLVGSMVFFAEADALWAIHLIGGHAKLKSGAQSVLLNAGDTALLDTGASDVAARSILDGGGDVILVRLQRIG